MIIALGEILNISKGKKATNVYGKSGESLLRYIQIEDLRDDSNIKYTDETALVRVNKDDIIIAWDGANAGTVGFGLTGIIGSTLARLSLKKAYRDQCNARYLGYFLHSKFEYLQNTAIGATIPHLSRSALETLEVDLQDLETQNKVVAILDKAKDVLNKREQTITKYDELLRAIFLEMFGDPTANTKHWPKKELGKLVKMERGRFSPRPRNDPSYFDGEYPFIQTGNIANSNYRLNDYGQTLNQKGIAVSKKFNAGEIVIAIVGATIGATAILEIDVYATDSIIGIKPRKDLVNNVFLEMLLRFYKKSLIDSAPEAARANINLSILGSILCIVPPIALQDSFLKIANTLSLNKSKLLKSKEYLDSLLKSISNLVFKGELDFNAAVDLEVLLEHDYVFFKKNSNSKTISLLLERLDKDELNERKFYEQEIYDKAKGFAFELLREERIKQVFDKKSGQVKMTIQ